MTSIFCYLVFLCCIFGLSISVNNDTLRSLHVFFRHGERTPIESYPTDPYNNLSYWPEGWGQLTNVGKLRMYNLGQHIRAIYKTFIPEYFKDKDMYMYSTDKSRTLMSAEGFLAGMYPPVGDQVWLKDLLWQPTPVHTLAIDKDPFYYFAKCPRAEDELNRIYTEDPDVKKFLDDHTEMWNYLRDKSGLPIPTIVNVGFFYNTLFVESENNLTIPKWAQEVFPEKIYDMAIYAYIVQVHNQLLQRLRAGPMLSTVIKNFNKVRNNQSSPRLYTYSVHDATLMQMTYAMDIFRPFIPPCGSCIIFELHQQEDQYSVQIKYLNDTEHDPEVMKLPGCSSKPECPLDEFIKIFAPIIPTNWTSECELKSPTGSNSAHPSWYPDLTFPFPLLVMYSCITMLLRN